MVAFVLQIIGACTVMVTVVCVVAVGTTIFIGRHISSASDEHCETMGVID